VHLIIYILRYMVKYATRSSAFNNIYFKVYGQICNTSTLDGAYIDYIALNAPLLNA
jgi:hypothetical protein